MCKQIGFGYLQMTLQGLNGMRPQTKWGLPASKC